MIELKIVTETAAELDQHLIQLAGRISAVNELAKADRSEVVQQATKNQEPEANLSGVVDEVLQETSDTKVKNKHTKKEAVEMAKDFANRPYGENVATLLKTLNIKSISAIPADQADDVIEGLKKMEAYFKSAEASETTSTESEKVETQETKSDAGEISLDQLRTTATDATQSGAISALDLKKLMKEVADVDRLSDIPADKRGEFLNKLNESILG